MPPATRAKRAMEEAPKPKEWVYCTASSCVRLIFMRMMSTERPVAARPTTPKPMAAPAVKATRRPSLRLPEAQATVVRTLPSVATVMPMKPAKPLRSAPTRRQAAERMPSVFAPSFMGEIENKTIKRTNQMKTYTLRYLYSSFRKAREPDFTCCAKASNFGTPMSLPMGCLCNFRFKNAMKMKQQQAAPKAATAAIQTLTSSGCTCAELFTWGAIVRTPLGF
mmetsp:Transcript_83774/g.234739  ORF Transcript_83774/g.234739 Transcript_83774/m.234739 type:complete len:222 (+) Transcript_83774:273-938(+)